MPSKTTSRKRAAKRRRPIAPRSISPAKWATMTAPAKAVAIAKDVLYRIAIGQLVASPGTWVSTDDAYGEDLQTVIRDEGQRCECCALGAALCGIAVFENRIKLDGFGELTLNGNSSDGCTPVKGRLIAVFGETNMRAMEVAFEGRSPSSFGAGLEDVRLYERAVAFGDRYTTDRGRLKAIWTNVIRNKGVFTP